MSSADTHSKTGASSPKTPFLDAVLQLNDPDTARARKVRKVLASCGLRPGPRRRGDQLQLPDDGGIVLAYDRGGEQSDDLLRECTATGRGVILYCEELSLPRVVELLLRGAAGYLCWPFDAAELRQAIQAAENLGSARIAFLAREAQAVDMCEKLSRREKEVFALCMYGHTSKDIGEELSISNRTVDIHRANILSKLGVNGPSAVRLGVYAGFDRSDR